jgi:hypothetical protein
MKTLMFVIATVMWCQYMDAKMLYIYAGSVAATALLKYFEVI